MAELSPEIIAALKRDLARCDEDRRTIAAATGRDEADSEWCAVIRLDRFRLALAALERIPELERRIQDKNFELAGVHEALRKETERAERVEAAAEEVLVAIDESETASRAIGVTLTSKLRATLAACEGERKAAFCRRPEPVRDNRAPEGWSTANCGQCTGCKLIAALAAAPAPPKLTEDEFRAGLARAKADYGAGESEAADGGR